ncbi:MAG TPA: deoxyribonuclease V [Armatimonadota bacterium]|jgi:deoxyribonuclease V|nr:deoxyribonuclease V [Armatimonadota bacterium]HPP75802.1 deoxyribonuclease V [Armatimonadota bacterium]
MRYKTLNSWDITPVEAVRIQEELRQLVVLRDDFQEIRTVAGVDVGLSKSQDMATGGVVVLSFPDLVVMECASASKPVTFPYIPGLLAFREIPAILAAFEKLTIEPDLLIVDGQGLAHPRRFGIACHLGLLIDRPSIGCGKTRLVGKYEEPGIEPGSSSVLVDDSERVGSVVRTKLRTKPVFVSPGHKINFETAERMVLECAKGYRLPEPVRLAHNLVSSSK